MIDEIGMVAHWFVYWIIKYFFQNENPVLFIMMGDPNQLRPVKSDHNVFSVDMQLDMKRIDLLESARFTPSYSAVIQQLRIFVDSYDISSMMSYICTHFPVVSNIDNNILRKCTRAMAYKTATVDTYNEFYLKNLVKGNRLRLLNKYNKNSFVEVKEGCKAFVTQNGVSDALNGTPVIFIKYDREKDELECKDPAKQSMVCITRNVRGDFPIAVGFAATIHKFQGDTMDDTAIAINFNDSVNLNLIYTALSRVKSMDQIVAIEM